MSAPAATAAHVAQINDRFRRTLSGGQIVFTRGVIALEPLFMGRAVEAMQTFNDFTPDNDPYAEHDFGAMALAGHKLFWKIDTYADDSLTYGAEDPADPRAVRVLTIMLAEEY